MKTFTYGDYIRAIHSIRLHKILKIMEEDTKYEQGRQAVAKHSKSAAIQDMIQDKNQVAMLINKNIEMGFEIKGAELMDYRNIEFLNENKNKPDAIYKVGEKELYIMLHYREDILKPIKYQMLNYSIELMQKLNKRDTKQLPKIIPVVVQKSEDKIKNRKNTTKIKKELSYREKEFEYNIINV